MKSLLKNSLQTSLRSAFLILRLIIPLYILADVLLYFDLLKYISFLFEPVTSFLHLPAEAAISIAGGMLINLYAALAFAAPLGLSPYQWTILAVFLGVCHSMIVETAIMKKIGIPYLYSITLRLTMAFLTVLPVMLLPASLFSTKIQQPANQAQVYDSFLQMLLGALRKASLLSFKVILLIGAIIFLMDWLKSTKFMQEYTKKVNSSFSIFVGQILGITYGAGILINEAKSGNLTRKEIFLVTTFLMISHAILEDVLLFVIFGANYWIVVGARLLMASLVSFIFLRLMKIFPSLKVTTDALVKSY
ncbi:MAG: nucleoside recognition protein [Anaerolineae bacterium]|jgi:hypothetical protein|nr:nucleoside recognition protein [Anaerolineae bacterium]MBT7072007.1 nucleoside recognition protein [Anaerolineae bacterium]MBT7324003.1 nucleoside recognition protein [Anaerolineae bacterium]